MPSTDRKPRIFIASSSEGLPTARAVKDLLEPDVDAQLWDDGIFLPGEFTLESLEARIKFFDGAVVVGTADDRLSFRGKEVASIRDNLLLEFGMFVATLGRRRSILALEGIRSTKVPSDLYGLTCVGFERTDPVSDGLGEAITEIRRVVATLPLEVVEPELAVRLEAVLRAFLGDLQEAIGATPQLGFHGWVVDPRLHPPRLVRVARSRTSPKARLGKDFAEGEGIVGECWRTMMPLHLDFDEEPYKSATQSTWDDFGPSVRKGMSFELLQTSRERYRAVGATPLISEVPSGNRFLGCLSYNVGPNISAVTFRPRLPDVEMVLDRAAEVFRIVLEST